MIELYFEVRRAYADKYIFLREKTIVNKNVDKRV